MSSVHSELGSGVNTSCMGSELKNIASTGFLNIFTLYAGSDTRPPMLDRTDFASWQQLIRLYCRGKENGVNILKSINEGPFQMGTFRETLAEGNEGETIHDYYVQFAKLINDMRNIKITMSIMQLNSKFVSNMLLEWGRSVTAVKLNRGLRDSNYDQLYAYLKQHEAHANENKMMLDQFTQYTVDPLALISNVAPQQTSSNPRNQATVQDGRVVVQNVQGRQNRGQGNNARGAGHIARNCTQPKQPQNSNYFKDKMLLMQAQENRVALDEEQLLFIAANDCDAFDSDVDEAPTA
ncbi:hypothetical protein Tco_0363847 [Tanacetum coccineum]